jgi:hypothetical protein
MNLQVIYDDLISSEFEVIEVTSNEIELIDLTSNEIEVIDLNSNEIEVIDLTSNEIEVIDLTSNEIEVIDLTRSDDENTGSIHESTHPFLLGTTFIEHYDQLQEESANEEIFPSLSNPLFSDDSEIQTFFQYWEENIDHILTNLS